MAKREAVQRKVRKRARPMKQKATRKTSRARRPARAAGPLFAAVRDATRTDVAGVRVDVGSAGAARVKRAIYPPGFRWSVDMKPLVDTDLCMHAHAGFLASGAIGVEYADGCVVEFEAPQVVAIAPGHDGWVIGDEPAVLIEFDFEEHTTDFLDMSAHRHLA